MNESFKEAASLLSDEPSQYEIERAKVLATLALAYEQRTANLIAALQPVRLLGGKEWLPDEGTMTRLRAAISDRLYPIAPEAAK